MSKSSTARERVRAALTDEIKNVARQQLSVHGADGLSLRAVAREMGMASSAIYRYFPSRDDLLTALIIDAYNALGDRVEQADTAAPADDHLARWRAVCRAVRGWARENPHEYALIYGSPVPGYRAPSVTIASAERIPVTLLRIVRDCHRDGRLADPPADPEPSPSASRQMALLAEASGLPGADALPPAALAAMFVGWTQLFGAVGFELFGHLEGVFDDKTALFEHCVDRIARLIGLPESPGPR